MKMMGGKSLDDAKRIKDLCEKNRVSILTKEDRIEILGFENLTDVIRFLEGRENVKTIKDKFELMQYKIEIILNIKYSVII